MSLVFRLTWTLAIVVASVFLTACNQLSQDVKFSRFDGHHMIIFNMIISNGGLATDPETGNPFYFVFVDNTNSLAADGSYEHPYSTLALAQANSGPRNIIYVFPGNGTTSGMNAGIALQAKQKLWGAGVSHVLQVSEGDAAIPALASSAPKITNTTGDGITLSTDNDISGFTLQNVSDNGIFGVNPKSIKISACTLDSSQIDQIHLEYTASAGPINLDNLTLTNGNQLGISIDSTVTSPVVDFTLSNTVIRDTADRSIEAAFASGVNVQFTNNVMQNNISSSNITFSGAATFLVSGNTFKNNTSVSSSPLIIIGNSGSLSAVIDRNTISGNTCGALRFVLNNIESTLSITNNTISNNGTGSQGSLLGSAILINPNNTTSGNSHVVLSDNTISSNNGYALASTSGDFNDFQMTASGNRITGHGAGGLIFDNSVNTFTLTATHNTISGGGDHGIAIVGNPTITTAHVTLSNNQITGNTGSANGVALTYAGTSLDFVATNNDLSQNDGSGILMYSSGSMGNITASIKNNTINNNQNSGSNTSGGIDLEQFTSLSLALDGNSLSSNVSSDVFVGSAEASPSVCMQMSDNSSTMGYVLSAGTGIFNLAPTNVTSVNVGTITDVGTITSVSSCP